MILAIETSCDESAVALFDPARGLTGEWVSSQVDLHGRYGGVVPELATREHLANLPLLLRETAGHPDFSKVEHVAVTVGPGLAGCLALGIASAKALALARGCPVVSVNHLRAHAWSPFIPVHASFPADFPEKLDALLPHVGLLVSGGNTALYLIESDRRIVQLSATIDDAAGEALDKGAKLLGLGYPGGPLIERHAGQGDAKAFDFPRALPTRGDLGFSFSGLKTSLRYKVGPMAARELLERRDDICASYQAAVIDVLVRKTGFALERDEVRSLGLCGGVANNQALRDRLAALAKERDVAFLPALQEHTGDNAGMIAFGAWMERGTAAVDRFGARLEPALELGSAPATGVT